MSRLTLTGGRLHRAVRPMALETQQGRLGRREFLARATALGATSAAAFSLLGEAGYAQPAKRPVRGGTLRIVNEVYALKDPRTFDRMPMANFARGWLEYLVEYASDGTFRPMLLQSWEVNDDATSYTLNLRPGVKWNTGEPFTATDVAHNFARWCDAKAEGNVMAGHLKVLVDPQTDQLVEGAVTVVDSLTLRLTLPRPDILIIPALVQFNACVTHPSYDGGDPLAQPIGTGPYLPESFAVGFKAVLARNEAHDWWGYEGMGGAWLDRIEYIDYGTDPVTMVSAAEADEVDMLEETVSGYIVVMDALDGWERGQSRTAQTAVIRTHQATEVDGAKPYADPRVRRALALAVNHQDVLELGYDNLGTVAENHHAWPNHPEYADIGPAPYDPAEAVRLMEEAGMMEFEHDLISIEDDWRRRTADAVAGQLRDAGFRIKRTVLPGQAFWNGWLTHPFSITNWSQRPLAVQMYALAYRTGVPWNESAWSNREFDETLDQALTIADADQRRTLTEKMQRLMREDGVIIQPYWRDLVRHHKSGLLNAEPHPTGEIQVYRLGYDA